MQPMAAMRWGLLSGILLSPIAFDGPPIALCGRAHAAPARRLEQDHLSGPEHRVLAVVHRHAVDAHLARCAGLAALHAGRGETAALCHEDDADRRLGYHLELDLLPEAAAELAGTAAAGAQLFAMHEEGAVAFDQLHWNVGDIARPRVGILP